MKPKNIRENDHAKVLSRKTNSQVLIDNWAYMDIASSCMDNSLELTDS